MKMCNVVAGLFSSKPNGNHKLRVEQQWTSSAFIKIGSTWNWNGEMCTEQGGDERGSPLEHWSRVTKIFHKLATNGAIKCQSAALPFCYLIAQRLSKPVQ